MVTFPKKRVLVTLSPGTLAAVEAHQQRGISNERFGCAPRSLSEAMRRLIIEGLERHEAGDMK